MIYHYVITVSVCLPRRWWQLRTRRSFHTASGHVKTPGPHTERVIYDHILAEMSKTLDSGTAHMAVMCYRLSPELSVMDPIQPDLYGQETLD